MRAPLHAPTVRYPYGPSRALGWLLGFIAVCGLATICAWLLFGTADADVAVKAAVGLGTWVLCAAAAWHGWRSMPVGHLFWDGGQWLLVGSVPGPAQVFQASPQVHLDLQAVILLSLQPAQGRVVWLWLERGGDAWHWTALRRAIYSPARDKAPVAADTMSTTSSRQDDGASTTT